MFVLSSYGLDQIRWFVYWPYIILFAPFFISFVIVDSLGLVSYSLLMLMMTVNSGRVEKHLYYCVNCIHSICYFVSTTRLFVCVFLCTILVFLLLRYLLNKRLLVNFLAVAVIYMDIYCYDYICLRSHLFAFTYKFGIYSLRILNKQFRVLFFIVCTFCSYHAQNCLTIQRHHTTTNSDQLKWIRSNLPYILNYSYNP